MALTQKGAHLSGVIYSGIIYGVFSENKIMDVTITNILYESLHERETYPKTSILYPVYMFSKWLKLSIIVTNISHLYLG